MIRKPEAEVFRDSTAVQVVRGAKLVVTEGVGTVARTAVNLWLAMLIVMAMLGAASVGFAGAAHIKVLAAVVIGAGIWALRRLFRAPSRVDAIAEGADAPLRGFSVPLPDHLRAPAADQGFHVDYWPTALFSKAAMVGLVGILVLPTSAGFAPLLGISVLMIARALLILSPLLGDRRCVVASSDALTVHTLLGTATLAWHEIEKVRLERTSRRNLWALLSTGTRRHLAVRGRHKGRPVEALIPFQLLGLNPEGAEALKARILPRVWEAVDVAPVLPAAPAAKAPEAATFSYRDTPERPFDPDAILARYLADRSPPALNEPPPPVRRAAAFGRKRAL